MSVKINNHLTIAFLNLTILHKIIFLLLTSLEKAFFFLASNQKEVILNDTRKNRLFKKHKLD